ncbi:sulfatase-like hydrolase/transferase [Planctomicrobium piriforme]
MLFQLAIAASAFSLHAIAAARPNIVLIYVDDLGFGDVSCNGAKAISTPNVDRLAARGLRFTDGHCTSATCTPSRYGMLTGEYPWRKKGTGVLPGDAGLIIEPGRATLASILQQSGYRTGVIGKWHLGLGDGTLNWNGKIAPGPLEIGFDECFLIPATGDRVPCVYVENHHVFGLDPNDPIQVDYKNPVGTEPTGREHPELLKMKLTHGHDFTIVNGISRIGYMSGGKSARWVDEDMADVITHRAVDFMERNQAQPFFLYFAYHDIHVPRVPHARFAGKSGMGPRGDAILEMDWCTGQVLDALERLQLTEKTLVIFTSDNGPVLDDGYVDDAVEKLGSHQPSGPYKGGKYSLYEGGTRVPFLVSWPGRIRAGESSALVCQIDFLASLGALTGTDLSQIKTAGDSQNVLPALLGESQIGRQELVEQGGGNQLALRSGNWKFLPAFAPKNAPAKARPLELFDLNQDPGETTNLASQYPERVNEMRQRLEQIQKNP